MLQRALWNLLSARGPKPVGVTVGLIVAVGAWAAAAVLLLRAAGVGEG